MRWFFKRVVMLLILMIGMVGGIRTVSGTVLQDSGGCLRYDVFHKTTALSMLLDVANTIMVTRRNHPVSILKVVSPDGQNVFEQQSDSQQSKIIKLSIRSNQGTHLTQIATFNSQFYQLVFSAWSPDSSKLMFAWLENATTGQLSSRTIAFYDVLANNLQIIPILNNKLDPPIFGNSVTSGWSPDSNYYVWERRYSNDDQRIVVWSVQDKRIVREIPYTWLIGWSLNNRLWYKLWKDQRIWLESNSFDPSLKDYQFKLWVVGDDVAWSNELWSPDGQYLMIVTHGSENRMYLFDVDGQAFLPVEKGLGDRNPLWSPDSQWVFFFRHTEPLELAAYHVKSGIMRTLVTHISPYYLPISNHNRIAVVRFDSTEHQHLDLINPDGTQHVSFALDGRVTYMTWSGDYLIVWLALSHNHRKLLWVHADGNNLREIDGYSNDPFLATMNPVPSLGGMPTEHQRFIGNDKYVLFPKLAGTKAKNHLGLYLLEFATGKLRKLDVLLSTPSDLTALWAPGGQHFYVRSYNGITVFDAKGQLVYYSDPRSASMNVYWTLCSW